MSTSFVGGRIRPFVRGFALAGIVAGAVALVLGDPVPAVAAPTCSPTTCSDHFSATGTAQQWTVPVGVTQLTVTLAGGAGGESAGVTGSNSSGATEGGPGGLVTATIAVTSQDVLTVIAGGKGADGLATGPAAGGYGGGADAGGIAGTGDYASGGGGGGGTFLFDGQGRLLIAVGGGGGGGTDMGLPHHGGAGGSTGAGAASVDTTDAATNGGGATTSAPGAGGSPGGQPGSGSATTSPTSLARGGQGRASIYASGGGGGGGYWGGGGGGWISNNVVSGAGGGGSAFIPNGAADVSAPRGGNTGAGYVSVSYANHIPTTTSLTVSADPTEGSDIVLTAHVVPSDGSVGPVTFSVDGVQGDPEPLVNGVATTTVRLAAGDHTLAAVFFGAGVLSTSGDSTTVTVAAAAASGPSSGPSSTGSSTAGPSSSGARGAAAGGRTLAATGVNPGWEPVAGALLVISGLAVVAVAGRRRKQRITL